MANTQASDRSLYSNISLNTAVDDHKLRCLQLNMQHARAATQNLNQLLESNQLDLMLIQEPYNLSNKVCGFSKNTSIFTNGNLKKRAAIVTKPTKFNVILLRQFPVKIWLQ